MPPCVSSSTAMCFGTPEAAYHSMSLCSADQARAMAGTYAGSQYLLSCFHLVCQLLLEYLPSSRPHSSPPNTLKYRLPTPAIGEEGDPDRLLRKGSFSGR